MSIFFVLVLLMLFSLTGAFLNIGREKSKEDEDRPEISMTLKLDKEDDDDDDDDESKIQLPKGPSLAEGCAFKWFWSYRHHVDCLNYVWHKFCVNGRCCGTLPQQQKRKIGLKTKKRKTTKRPTMDYAY